MAGLEADGKDEPFRHAVELTLTRMCQGGIYDHLGGGFARYAVDERWLVPHFEKMLYDNAQLIDLLTWAWQETGNPLYETRVRETVGWLLREMIAQADETGETLLRRLRRVPRCGQRGRGGQVLRLARGGDRRAAGPISRRPSRPPTTSHPRATGRARRSSTASHAAGAGRRRGRKPRLARARAVLFEARAPRVRPGWDDKVLADWNGLMIAALARAAPVFDEPAWLAAAETAFRFIVERMTEDGRLMHSWRRGQLKHPATLDDYANLCGRRPRLAPDHRHRLLPGAGRGLDRGAGAITTGTRKAAATS